MPCSASDFEHPTWPASEPCQPLGKRVPSSDLLRADIDVMLHLPSVGLRLFAVETDNFVVARHGVGEVHAARPTTRNRPVRDIRLVA